ncbi:quercetin dioxygenase-like cupin family protein [Wenyingzhuangia heitensis]|uniref:Quercetin dioxygenase-like cupin family protein n=1 Tax=Wenyingzhuangia heitensis TaxID=1487859 RepID=A0ABX0UE83_9FLAO|nr:cupin domain-containing protein [Wenyingzhuangia heitensis]NIJ45761.1 quercetin dioxygenase-like cupin family protein [Wenyingzhuangia heitensis]
MESFGASKEFLFDSETAWESVGNGVQRQIMGYDDRIMLVKAKFETGGIGQMHEHHHSQVTYVVDGAFELTIGETTKMVKGGDSFYIPPHVMHGAICKEAGLLIDVFSPIREDFMKS